MNETDYNKLVRPDFPKATEADAKDNTDKYRKIQRKRRILTVFLGCMLLTAEVAGCVWIAVKLQENKIPNRLVNAIEVAETGKLQLQSGIYTGGTDFGYILGEGTVMMNDGTKMSGEWTQNELEGLGETFYPNGDSYIGDYQDSLREGHGEYTWADGSNYSGGWASDAISGSGTYITENGTTFTGTFAENLFLSGDCIFNLSDCSGTLLYLDGEVVEADIVFADGTTFSGAVKSGPGETVYSNGDVFIGNYADGKREGEGTYTWSSGEYYSGEWYDDKMSGEGKYTFTDGSYAEGVFSNNKLASGKIIFTDKYGACRYTVADGKETEVSFTASDGTKYDGGISDGQLTGYASIKYSNGDVYSGNVINGQKSGEGVYTWKDGASYKGNWKNDLMNGEGIYYFKSSASAYCVEGTFKDGFPNGTCYYYTSASTSYKTDWSNGKCVKIYE